MVALWCIVDVLHTLHIHLITYDIRFNFSSASTNASRIRGATEGIRLRLRQTSPAISIEHLGDHDDTGSWTQRQNAFPSDVTGFYWLSNDEDGNGLCLSFSILAAFLSLRAFMLGLYGWRSFGSVTFGFRLSSGIWNRAAILPPALSFHDDRKDPFRKFLRGSILKSEELAKIVFESQTIFIGRLIHLIRKYRGEDLPELRFRNRWKIPPLQSRTKEEGRVTRSLDTELIYVKSLLRKCHHVPEADRVTSREKVKYLVQERE
ncbi:hypothetical protein EV368DRAFT_65124 [Lentinula lateritia]|nr:hypothetical protein EV368DRAFT_65124 [Lentinula lateritia]